MPTVATANIGLGVDRPAMIELRAGSPPRSLMRAAADQMISNIDELAWILTGERDLFVVQGTAAHCTAGNQATWERVAVNRATVGAT